MNRSSISVEYMFFDTVQHLVCCANRFPAFFTYQDALPLMQPQHACSPMNKFIYLVHWLS